MVFKSIVLIASTSASGEGVCGLPTSGKLMKMLSNAPCPMSILITVPLITLTSRIWFFRMLRVPSAEIIFSDAPLLMISVAIVPILFLVFWFIVFVIVVLAKCVCECLTEKCPDESAYHHVWHYVFCRTLCIEISCKRCYQRER